MIDGYYSYTYPAEPLTDEEKKNPYSHIYDIPMPDPEGELIDAFLPGHEMRPSDALPITQIKQVFIPGRLKVRNGFCMLPDGSAYCAVNVKMPDITPEMNRFWTETRFVGQDDVHYKIWFPGMHVSHKMPPVEDLGWGMGTVCFEKPIIPMEYTDSPPELLDPLFEGSRGCAGYFTLLSDTSDKWYNTTVNVTRRLPEGGLEIQIVNWAGVHLLGNDVVFKLPKGGRASLERCRLYACHNVYENIRKNQIFPIIWDIKSRLQPGA